MIQECVLVIDDNSDMRIFLNDAVLEPAGYRVLMATQGNQGLKYAVEAKPDLIMLDLQLPRLSGIDLLKLLVEHGIHIPTIVISAYGSEETILKAFRLGAKDFLQKPFTMDEAKQAIQNALREERLRREKEQLTQALAATNQRLQHQVNNWAALNDIALTMTSTLEESEVFRCVVESVNRILQVEAGSLLLFNPDTGKLEFAATTKGNIEKLSSLALEPNQGIAGWVAQHGKPLIVSDAGQDPRFFAQVDRITGFRSRAIMCVPLQAQEQVIGVLEVINKKSGPQSPSFTQEDLKLLTTLSSWVAVAVRNAQFNRATAQMAATTALGQAIAAIAHHINNRLMTFSLQLDSFERVRPLDRQTTDTFIASARQCIYEVASVIKALDQLEEIHTVPYIGDTQMIDIEDIVMTENSA